MLRLRIEPRLDLLGLFMETDRVYHIGLRLMF